MYQVPVRIKKSAIKDVCGHSPRLLKSHYKIDGADFPTGQLVFLGFRGVKVAAGVWGGDYCFDGVGNKVPEESVTAEQLEQALAKPGFAGTKKK